MKYFLLVISSLIAMTSAAQKTVEFVDKGILYMSLSVDSATVLNTVLSSVPDPQNDDENYAGYTFAGWAMNKSTKNPQFVDPSTVVTDNMQLYAVYSCASQSAWEQTTTVEVGDEVVIAEVDDSEGWRELSSFSTTSTVYGIGSLFTSQPEGMLTYIVEEGTQEGFFSFRNSSTGNYLYWVSGKNSISEQSTKTDYSSWKICETQPRALLQNYVNSGTSDARYIYWMTGKNARFSCYVFKAHGQKVSSTYYFNTVFYRKAGDKVYSLEAVEHISGGLEIPVLKDDGSTLFIDHRTKSGNEEIRTYALEFDKEAYHSRWVAFRFDGNTRATGSGRGNDFRDDPDLDVAYWIGSSTFGNFSIGGVSYTVDRGHICASNDRTYSVDANSQTFYMSNMSPQIAPFNQGYWANLEAHIQKLGRDWGFCDTLYIVKGGTIDNGHTLGVIPRTFNGEVRNVVVPEYYFMALLKVRNDEKKGNGYKGIAFLMRHQKYDDNAVGSHLDFVVSIDSLEALTGIDFFHSLPADVEKAVESRQITNNVLNDWGFSLPDSGDAYEYVYVQQGMKGDANEDAKIDVADITTVASYILGSPAANFNFDNADANSDGKIDVADITFIAGLILDKVS